MKEISKKELMEQLEMGELAYKTKGTQDTSNKIAKFRPIFRSGNETDIPDAWEINLTKEPGKGTLFVPTDCEEVEAFIENNKEWLDELGLTTSLEPMLNSCKRTKDQPRNKKAGTTYVPSGISNPAETKIKTELNRLVEEYLANPEISSKLEKLSIPEIKSRDRKHLNKYGRVDNNKILYQTHTFNSYETSQQFLKFVTARISGKPIEDKYKSYHLARQFNQNYMNWDETKKNELHYVGKTDAYKLDKYGFDEDNLDVTVRMDLKIEGTKMNNQYLWVVNFKTKFGRKLKEERYIMGGLSLDKDLTIKKEVDFDPSIEFSDKFTVLNSIEIKSALIEALDELSKEIMKWKPIQTLSLATVKQSQITKRPTQTNVNEEVTSIVGKVLNKLKK
jgi:hypothetical protein